MDWSRSYNAVWRVFKVDEATWQDSQLIGGVDSVTVTRSCGTKAPMLESGSMTLTGDFERGYYRIVMNATQGVESTRVDVATLLCESRKSVRNYNVSQPNVTCNSVLYPASVQVMLDGSFMPAGVSVAQYVSELLGGCIKAPIQVDDDFTISDFYWFDFGISILDAAWEALNLGGFVMQIDGRGTVHIRQKPSEVALELDGSNVALLGTSITSDFDTSKVPNRYIAKSDDVVAIAINDDPESDVSTVRRGYIYDELDESPATVNDETLPQYAMRRLEEMSTDVSETRSYTREYVPGVLPYDLVRGTNKSIGIDGKLRIVNQSLKCDYGITVSEQAAKEVKLWQA